MPNLFDDSEFDKQFNRTFETANKTIRRGFLAVAIFWLFSVVLGLALTGGLIYVAIHFIQKYW